MNTMIGNNWDSVKPFQEQIVNFYRAIGFNYGDEYFIRASKDEEKIQIVLRGTIGDDALIECKKKAVEGESAADYIPVGAIHSDGVAYLRRLAADGYDIFCYPNHVVGGIGNRHSTRSTCIFYEIDDLPLDQQRQKLIDLAGDTGLIPAAVVFSGGKSLHAYLATEDLTPDQRQTLMWLLTIRQNSDPAICNVSRAMRLPGVPRVKNGEMREVSLEEVNLSAPKYSYSELFSLLGGDKLPYGVDDDRWRKWRNAKTPAEKHHALHSAPLPPPVYHHAPRDLSGVSGRVSIFDIIKKTYLQGVGQGERNDRAFVVACHALATESWALSVPGLYLDGDARQVFDDFCQSCSPPLTEREREKVWKSALKSYKALDAGDVEIKERIVGRLLGAQQVTPLSPTARPQVIKIARSENEVAAKEKKKRDLPRPQFTADTISTGRYLPDDIPVCGLTVIKAPFGTGKTEYIKRLTAQSEDADNLLIGHRITLLRQTVARTGATSYQDIPNGRRITAACVSSGTLAICVNSLLRIQADQAAGEFENLIFDEVVGVLNALLFDSTLKDDRFLIMKILEELLAKTKSVLSLDGNVTDAEIQLLSALAPHLPVYAHRHTVTDRQPIKIRVFNGMDKDGKYHRDAWKNQLAIIYRAMASGKLVSIPSDSADLLQAIGEDLAALLGETLDKGHSPSIRLITGDTSGEKWAQDFLESPDEQLDGVRVVLFSPAAVSGVSIMTYFDTQVGIFCGKTITASDISQMIGRFRNVGEREVIIPAFVDGVEYPAWDPDAEERRMVQRWQDEARRVGICDTLPDINPAYTKYAAKREWLNKSEKHQLADAVAGYLRENGYEPEFVFCDAEAGDAEKERIQELKKSIRLRESEAVAKAVPLTHAEYEALKGGNATIENQRRILRYEFEKTFPGLAITPALAHVYLYERVSEALTLAALLSLPVERLQPVMARQYLQILRSRRKDFPWLTNHTAARFYVIRELLLALEGREVKSGDPILVAAGEMVRKQDLGISLAKMSNTQAVKTILKCAGSTLEMTRQYKGFRYYSIEKKPPIDAVLWDGMLDATIRRITEQVAKMNEKQEQEATATPSVEVAASEKPAVATTLETITPPPYIDLNRGGVTELRIGDVPIPPGDVPPIADTSVDENVIADDDVAASIPLPPVTPVVSVPIPPVSVPSIPVSLPPVTSEVNPLGDAVTHTEKATAKKGDGNSDVTGWIGMRVRSALTGLWGIVYRVICRRDVWDARAKCFRDEWCVLMDFGWGRSDDPVPISCLRYE